MHFAASMMSGLVTTLAYMPVDIIKTRLQNMAPGNPISNIVGHRYPLLAACAGCKIISSSA